MRGCETEQLQRAGMWLDFLLSTRKCALSSMRYGFCVEPERATCSSGSHVRWQRCSERGRVEAAADCGRLTAACAALMLMLMLIMHASAPQASLPIVRALLQCRATRLRRPSYRRAAASVRAAWPCSGDMPPRCCPRCTTSSASVQGRVSRRSLTARGSLSCSPPSGPRR
jgi:hypothetical protein